MTSVLKTFRDARFALFCLAIAGGTVSALPAGAQEQSSSVDTAKIRSMREAGVNFLKSSQADDGSWTIPTQPGISGLVVCALLDSGLKPDDPNVAKGLKHLMSFVQKDGGIYYEKSGHKNYETCIIMMALSRANTDGKYDEMLRNAEKYVKEVQWDEGEKIDRSDVKYGGAGYGRTGDRPDLSNTAFLMEALRDAGAKENDPALQRALVFVSRSQNLESEHNTLPFAAKVNDGGFYYTPALGGQSQAGTVDNGGLRSYASMTYAGLKSMIYAGVKQDDPRVKAAFGWVRRHYTMTENPGMGQQGLFYYYHTLAKALSTMKVDQLTDTDGKAHDWRKDLVAELSNKQSDNGAWVNKSDRWMEGDPNLSTSYALLALHYCEPKSSK